MSTIKVEVTQIKDVHNHPNADALDLATVGGWQMCVKRDSYKDGDKVVYFEQGTVLPAETAERFGVKNYLSEKTDIDGNRVLVVHRVKLRGEPSFGLVVSPESGMAIGQDVANHYGAFKFKPPVKSVAGDAEVDHVWFPAYTDIENMRSYPDVFADGEEVVATEKLHGTNCRAGFIVEDGTTVLMAGSRTLRRKEPIDKETNTYWFPHTLPEVQRLFAALAPAKQVVLFGEVYGQGIQSYDYGKKVRAFRAFDLMMDGEYMNYDDFADLCEDFGVEMVPVTYRGPFSLEAIKAVSNGPSLIGGTHGREGVVIRPIQERDDARIGRVILKYVGDQYLFGKAAEQDTTDV